MSSRLKKRAKPAKKAARRARNDILTHQGGIAMEDMNQNNPQKRKQEEDKEQEDVE